MLVNETVRSAAADASAEKNLGLMDRLDFESWNELNWDVFSHLHTPDVLVVNSDGSSTVGLDSHIDAMKAAIAPVRSSTVLSHPVRIGAGEWTATIGYTDTVLEDGTSIKSLMCTVARWVDGAIAEEILFMQSGPLRDPA